MKRFALCCAVMLAAFGGPAAQSQDADSLAAKALDACIAAHAANGDFSGVVLVTRQGRPIFQKSVGLASQPFEAPNGPDTRFVIASVTKTSASQPPAGRSASRSAMRLKRFP